MTLFNKFKKHKRHVAFCVSVPHNEDQFRQHYELHSDFLTQLAQRKRINNLAALWKEYSKTANRIENCIRKLEHLGVTIYDQCTAAEIIEAQNHDAVIIMAHKHSNSNQVELCGTMLSPNEFVDLFDRDFSGAIDLACCNSVDLLKKLAVHCPKHKPIVAPAAQISVDIHAILLPFIVENYLRTPKKEYVEVFHDVYLDAVERRKAQELSSPLVMLGSENNHSSIYAPRTATRGSNFTIQIYLHGTDDKKEIEIRAKAKDGKVELKDTRSLKLPLKDGDNIKIRLQIANNQNEDFSILDDEVIETSWDGTIDSQGFLVHITDNCHEDTCNCILQLFVNERKVGTIFFNVDIVDKQHPISPQPTAFEKVETHEDSCRKALVELRQIIKKHLLESTGNEEKKAILSRCLSLLDYIDNVHSNGVFVSSTSELKEARQAVVNGINSVYMNPVMYEHWPAMAMRPIDACSKEVMASKCFILLLGSHYGYVEDSLGLSMTQIEYLVAKFCDKPILVFTEKDLTQKMTSINEDQQKFIAQVMREYTIKEYSTMQELSNGVQLALIAARQIQ